MNLLLVPSGIRCTYRLANQVSGVRQHSPTARMDTLRAEALEGDVYIMPVVCLMIYEDYLGSNSRITHVTQSCKGIRGRRIATMLRYDTRADYIPEVK